jgi:predicted oxidoreductase
MNITPLAWSPLAGGLLSDGASDILPGQKSYKPAPIVKAIDDLAKERGTSRTTIAVAWLLKHPTKIIPIIGSTNPDRIRAAAAATEIGLSREEWYRLLIAARGEPLP